MFERTFKYGSKVFYKKYLKPEKSMTAIRTRRNAVKQILGAMFQKDETNSKSDEES